MIEDVPRMDAASMTELKPTLDTSGKHIREPRDAGWMRGSDEYGVGVELAETYNGRHIARR